MKKFLGAIVALFAAEAATAFHFGHDPIPSPRYANQAYGKIATCALYDSLNWRHSQPVVVLTREGVFGLKSDTHWCQSQLSNRLSHLGRGHRNYRLDYVRQDAGFTCDINLSRQFGGRRGLHTGFELPFGMYDIQSAYKVCQREARSYGFSVQGGRSFDFRWHGDNRGYVFGNAPVVWVGGNRHAGFGRDYYGQAPTFKQWRSFEERERFSRFTSSRSYVNTNDFCYQQNFNSAFNRGGNSGFNICR